MRAFILEKLKVDPKETFVGKDGKEYNMLEALVGKIQLKYATCVGWNWILTKDEIEQKEDVLKKSGNSQCQQRKPNPILHA